MYLKSIAIKNFRSFSDLEVPLCRDLTIFVGENNGGKSNAIDAIRLLTPPLSGRRELYCEPTDVRFGSVSRRFELKGTYAELSPAQQGRLLSAAADPSLESAIFGLSYDETSGTYPIRPTIWAGSLKGPPEPGSQQMVRHVYLPPLRDAKRVLASGNPTRIYALLRHFLGDDQPEELAKRLARDASDEILSKVDGAVKIGLTALTAGVRRQDTSLGFATDEKLIDIARDLRFKLADQGITPEDLRYSGHGYANLLYMATIAVELEKANDADLTLFLVEEPEAHLHPQLQAAVLGFLEEQVAKSKRPESDHHGPAGELQVIVATHSPNLSAWVEGRKLVVFRSLVDLPEPKPEAGPEAKPESKASADVHGPDCPGEAVGDSTPSLSAEGPASAAQRRRASRCVPLGALGLGPVEWRKVDRYLDVTKSALLFGGRVLLVEGIAEALLLPVIASKHVLKDRTADLQLFRSAVFVAIDGVDFEPYVRLLVTTFSDVRIADRVVVVTDGDQHIAKDGGTAPGKARRNRLLAVAAEAKATHVLDTVVNDYSLETELFLAGNDTLMRSVYLEFHPNSEANWQAATAKSGDAQALALQGLFGATSKGDFAQVLAERIAEGEPFKTPLYIAEAIEALVR